MVFAAGLIVACSFKEIEILSGEWCAAPRGAIVDCAIDGDTIDLDVCGEGERIRLLGVDAPEVTHGDVRGECFGDESGAALGSLLSRTVVTLEFDETCADVDGRTLAWVWLEGEDPVTGTWLQSLGLAEDPDDWRVLVNELVIRAGYAERYEEEFAQDVRFYGRLGVAEAHAAAEGLGLWSACADTGQ